MENRSLPIESFRDAQHPRSAWLAVKSVANCSGDFLESHLLRADGWKLVFVMRGSGTVLFDDVEAPIAADAAVLLVPGTSCRLKPGEDGLTFLAIGFEGVSLAARSAKSPMLVADAAELRTAIDLFQLTAGRTGEPVGPELDALASVLLATFCRLLGANSVDAWMCQVRQYVVNHLADPIQVEDVAAAVGLSASRFSHRFKEETGTTFKRFLTGLRVRAAVAHLLETDLPTQEIAQLVGFNGADYMSRVVRQGSGHTPSAIRLVRRREPG